MFKPFHVVTLTAALALSGAFALHLQLDRPLFAQQTPTTQRPATEAATQQRESLKGAPDRRADEGKGPFKTLAIRNVMLIDGSGAPPAGPMDVIVSGNRISSVRSAGTPGLPQRANRGPQADHEIDGTGMYLMPGFVDLHVHAGGAPKNEDAEYAYKLWLAHGVTTVRGVPLGPNAWSVREKERSAKNEIVAPRIYNYQRPGSGWDGGSTDTPEKAKAYVEWAAKNGVDGLKLGAERPEVMKALLDTAKANGLGSTAHLQQSGVAHMNAIKAARLGLGTVTHFYGHFESLLKDYTVQPWPVDMNASDEQWRFGQVARLWDKIHPPGSPEWKAYLEELL
jgi:imidazolonepropionase-like amidohydrolase